MFFENEQLNIAFAMLASLFVILSYLELHKPQIGPRSPKAYRITFQRD